MRIKECWVAPVGGPGNRKGPFVRGEELQLATTADFTDDQEHIVEVAQGDRAIGFRRFTRRTSDPAPFVPLVPLAVGTHEITILVDKKEVRTLSVEILELAP